MSGDLSSWQQRLKDHFRELASHRVAANGGTPVFALEHGLDTAEVEAVATAVRAHVASATPSLDHALAWVVYAAEIGYGYSGDEYWQTFEEQTPGWTIRGDRYWLRDCYRLFQRAYNGARPSGAWAQHFSIICWPITHAILPRDLQRQLARVLYELRHSFSAELFESPAKLGEFIAARSWNATSRFRNFAQDAQLVGQIAAALLLNARHQQGNLIHSATLRRIGADIDRERRAREWLRGARHFAQERAAIRGLAVGRDASSPPVRRPEEVRAEVAALGIEPRLVLRPTSADSLCWEVTLEIPDLSHILLRFPKTRDTLVGSRCVVAGASGRPLARGRCLHGAQRVTLSRWPRADEVLLQFEKTDAQLEYLLRTECLLRPVTRWLFRIASDGLAYESRSLRVRPSQRYIVVTNAEPTASSDYARSIDVACEGVHAALLTLPDALNEGWERALRRLGLSQAKSIEVWPAGLDAVVWDGEGHGEWLASECPCLAIRTDHPLSALTVSIGSELDGSLKLTSIAPGEPIFVELPQLPVGLHTIRVTAQANSATEAELLGEIDVVMRIREARPWVAGATPTGPLVVQVDPPTPTLEQLWEGHVDVEILGPPGRSLKCVASLFQGRNPRASVVETLPSQLLPLAADRWRAHFDKFVRQSKEAQQAYDSARMCRLEFSAEELGTLTVECERDFVPLRWAVRRSGGNSVVRLLDDSGVTSPAEVSYYTFGRPTVAVQLAPSLGDYPISPPGGLYVARRGDFTTAVVAVPRALRSLADLGGTPEVLPGERSGEAVMEAVEISRLWGSARSSGDILSLTKQRSVLQSLTRHLLVLIGGDRWARAEQDVSTGRSRDLSDLKLAVSSRRDQLGIAAALALDVVDLAAAKLEARVGRLAELVVSFRVVEPNPLDQELASPRWLSEFSLRLASSPKDAVSWAGPQLRPAINRLLVDVPVLARAARFLVITVDRQLGSVPMPGEVYASWGWS